MGNQCDNQTQAVTVYHKGEKSEKERVGNQTAHLTTLPLTTIATATLPSCTILY